MKVELSEKQVEVLKGTLESYLKVLGKMGAMGAPKGKRKYKRTLKEILKTLKSK